MGPSPPPSSEGSRTLRREQRPRPRPRREQTLRRWNILRRSADYLRCYRRGRRFHGSLLTLHIHLNEEGEARLGITASRKVGNAVIRHRAKRRVREVFRRWPERSALPPVDLVVHLKPAAGKADFGVFKEEVENLLARAAEKRGCEQRAGRQRSRERSP